MLTVDGGADTIVLCHRNVLILASERKGHGNLGKSVSPLVQLFFSSNQNVCYYRK